MRKLILAVLTVVLLMLLAAGAFAAPPTVCDGTSITATVMSAKQSALMAAAPDADLMMDAVSIVAAARDVGTTQMTALQAAPDTPTSKMASTGTFVTTFTKQAALDPATRHVWTRGAYTFTRTIADSARTSDYYKMASLATMGDEEGSSAGPPAVFIGDYRGAGSIGAS